MIHTYTELQIQGYRARFEKKFIKRPTGCWIWTASKDYFGYGKLGIVKNYSVLAHRFSWLLYKGPFDKNLCVLHKCDDPSCVNPAHLFLGTKKENSLDMAAKGRSTATLSRNQIAYIKASGLSLQKLANELGVTKQAIYYHKRKAAEA